MFILAESATERHDHCVEVIDPTVELAGQELRKVVAYCMEYGRMLIGYHGGDDRMAERQITGGMILAALRGSLRTDQCVAGKWRYLARKNDVEVCFTFDVDEDGNLLVTVMRKG
jgi:hypothetical protein